MGNQLTLHSTKAYSEPSQESKMTLFQFTIFAKNSILDVCQRSESASVQQIIKINKPNELNKNQDM